MIHSKAYLQPGPPSRQDRDRMQKDIIQRISDGIDINGTKAYARNMKACRLRDAQNLEVYLKDSSTEIRIFCIAIFPGRGPHYRSWIEIFCVKDRLNLRSLGADCYDYYDSDIEDALLGALCGALDPGDRIFIEYYCDHETSCGLAMGIPPVLSRQGYKLFNLGFTWFKDWYFSEGGHEGGQKLQGEKPLDKLARMRHLRRIKDEVQSFIENTRNENANDDNLRDDNTKGEGRKYIIKAYERANELLARIDAELNESYRTSVQEESTLVCQRCSQ